MQISPSIIRDYAATRSNTNTSLLCHAPSVNLNFEQNGNVRACCYNFKEILGTWPQNSIKEIWKGHNTQQLRNHIQQNHLGSGCLECGKMITAGNYQGVRAKYYDEYAQKKWWSVLKNIVRTDAPYPKVMEFELSNKCNLECIMCNGYFSSSIRKNREKLPALESPYNDDFVTELEEFIPHLTDAKFLGGEPFLIDIYLKIWEAISRINPSIKIHITTNCTLLSDRVKALLEKLNAGIIVSIDSVNALTYQKIRQHQNFNQVMQNLTYLKQYTQRKNTFMSLAACPITLNRFELPDLLDFCLKNQITLYFNAVFSPSHLSLKELPEEQLLETIHFLKQKEIPAFKKNGVRPNDLSIKAYLDFIKLLEDWRREKEENPNSIAKANAPLNFNLIRKKVEDWSIDIFIAQLKKYHQFQELNYIDKELDLLNQLGNLMADTPKNQLEKVFLCYFSFAEKNNDGIPFSASDKSQKANWLASLINSHHHRETILIEIAKSKPDILAQLLLSKSEEELIQLLNQNFGQAS